ncbi:MAG: hypothetical protein MUO26_02495 [Methanotrichaceae archaeon]|nr:hypothetical protein [Methanotrichaceae archaeon]
MAKVELPFIPPTSPTFVPPCSLSNASMRFRGIGFYPISVIWWTSLIVSTPIGYISRTPAKGG